MVKSEIRFYYVINYFQSFNNWLIVDDSVRATNNNYLLTMQWPGKWMRNIWVEREGDHDKSSPGPKFCSYATVVILYDKTSSLSSVSETRKELFCHKNRAMDKVSPTKDALLQHARRVVYQARVWTTSAQAKLVNSSPRDFAWTKVSQSWVPAWMTIPEISPSS